jgi:hypothetical protein
MKNCISICFVLLAFSLPVLAQQDIEFNGGYQHASGDQGLDGFTAGAGWNPLPQFQLYLNYDGLFDHSTLGSFALTSTGLTIINSHLEEFLTGPRYFLPGLWKGHGRIQGHRFIPFIDAGFGEAHLHSELRQVNIGTVDVSDTAFAWALGGGADYRIYPHFTIRGNVGLLRTHFAESGQSRVRLGVTVVWSIQSRAQ